MEGFRQIGGDGGLFRRHGLIVQLARQVQAELGHLAQDTGVLLGDVRQRQHEQTKNIMSSQSQVFRGLLLLTQLCAKAQRPCRAVPAVDHMG